MIKLKYVEPQIKYMSDAELNSKSAVSLKVIHVITGWNLPDDIDYVKALLEQFVLKLKEDFSELNFQEISYAFRKSVGIKDWGKSMNLELICQVLADFSSQRYDAGVLEERAKPTPPAIVYTEDELDNMQRQWTEEFYQRVLNGSKEVIPTCVYKILVKDDIIIDERDTKDYIIWAAQNGIKNIYLSDNNE